MFLNESSYLDMFPYAYCTLNEFVCDRNIKIYYEGIEFNKKCSRFTIFCGDVFLGNITFPTEIIDVDKISVSKSMIEELRLYLGDIDEDIFTEEWEGNLKFINTIQSWNGVYGEGSINHKKYLQEKLIYSMKEFFKYSGEDIVVVSEVLEYLIEYSPKKCKYLFQR